MMNWFQRGLLVGALSAGMMLSGCTQPGQPSGRSSSSGSLALSSDDSLLYAVDTDNGIVAVVDTQTDAKIAEVKVGERPARVVVGSDDTIYVTNRGSNTVSVIRKGDWKVAATVEVGTEPVGLAVSPDNKMLYVVNATSIDAADFGTLSAIDVATLQPSFEVKLGAEPRGITMLGNDKAVVTLLKEGELVEVDVKNQALVSNKIGVYEQANPSGTAPAGFSNFRARGMTEVVATPDGTRVFAPAIWAREGAIGRRPTSSGGYYSSGGPCNIGAVATAGIVVANTGGSNIGGGTLEPQVDDLTACFSSGTTAESNDYPTTTLAGRTSGSGGLNANQLQGPSAAAIDPTGSWLFIVNKESSNVAVLPTYRRTGEDLQFRSNGSSVRDTISVGAKSGSPEASGGPDGIALTGDGKKAYVYNQFDHQVDLLTSEGVGAGARISKSKSIPVAGDTLSPEFVAGRRFFFSAVDPRLSAGTTNVACATCHIEGMDDGHVWSFPDGPRQTPALSGRKLGKTMPYHWSGEFPTTGAFMDHTIRERMGGTGLGSELLAQQIVTFIDGMPAPKNANLKLERTEAQLRGAQVFQKAQCATCHSGETLTNNTNVLDVGTLVRTGTNPDNGLVLTKGLNVPSLLGLARSAPYLHDGSALTLEARLNLNPSDKHGTTSTLTAAEKSDLVAYLKTL